MTSVRTVAVLAAGLLVVPAGMVVVAAGPAAAVACGYQTEYPEVGSIDSDDAPDIASYVSGFPPGLVDLHLTAVGAQRVDASDFAGNLQQGQFGAALASIDLDHDGCSELIVGAPGMSTGNPSAVDILEGSPLGVSSSGIRVLTPSVQTKEWGLAVAVGSRGAGPTDKTDLWIGAPDRTVDGLAEAGAVDHYVVSAGGVPTFVDTVTADTPGIGGTVHADAHFGQTLSASQDDVLIGAPGDTVSGQVGAGSATLASVDTSTDHVTSGHYWTQNSPGVPGSSEAGDHFGAAVYNTYDVQVVGVPGEDVGTVKDAGMVQFFENDKPSLGITQNSAGIPGTAQAGNGFGTSVALGTWLLCQESGDAAIGAPGQQVGSAVHAGSVTVMQIPGQTGTSCPATVLTQGSGGLGGAAEAGDAVGTRLSILRGRDDFDEDIQDTLVIGDPGEDLGTVVNAGIVIVHTPGHEKSYSFSEGTYKNTAYGLVLVSPGGGPMYAVPDN